MTRKQTMPPAVPADEQIHDPLDYRVLWAAVVNQALDDCREPARGPGAERELWEAVVWIFGDRGDDDILPGFVAACQAAQVHPSHVRRTARAHLTARGLTPEAALARIPESDPAYPSWSVTVSAKTPDGWRSLRRKVRAVTPLHAARYALSRRADKSRPFAGSVLRVEPGTDAPAGVVLFRIPTTWPEGQLEEVKP